MVGQRVMVTHGNIKGYRGIVKDVGTLYVRIEVDAKLVGTNAPYNIQWAVFMIV